MEPASLYLVAVLILVGVWLVGDRTWAVANAISARMRHHDRFLARTVAAAVGVVIALTSWRVAPVGASIIPQRDRTIVQIESSSEPPTTAMTLRTLMAPDAVTVRSSDAAQDIYVVVPGDCLWTIARSLLLADGLPATGSETSTLWRSIYKANRDLIGSNPNLIFPGQVLDLPER